MLGKEIVFDKSLLRLERLYVRIFGIPINGLRNRARRVLPLISNRYKRILDSGCGQSVFTFEIARRLPETIVTGLDINKTLIERNRHIHEIIGLKIVTLNIRIYQKRPLKNNMTLFSALMFLNILKMTKKY